MVLSQPSILITDDDTVLRETLRSVFEPRGFRTLLAGDGEEALAIVQREPIHVLLMDLQMPRLSGLEALRRLQQLHYAPPCILMSGALDERVVAEARRCDVFSVLAKPIRCADVTLTVTRALKTRYDWQGDG